MTERTCSIDGCESRHKGHGYCSKHYQRYKKSGDPLRLPGGVGPRSYARGETCSVGDCDRSPTKRGYCGKHYQRWAKFGNPIGVARIIWPHCRAAECGRDVFGHGYCSKHYYRFVATGDPEVLPGGRLAPGTYTECVIPDCIKKPRGGNGMCTLHAGNFRATGDPLTTPGPKIKSRSCVKCGTTIDFTKKDERGKRLSPAMRVCRACRRESGQVKYVPYLVARDGNKCGICTQPVNLELRFPDQMSRSVDHVVPRALGGADDVSNYQLAHYICNVRKHARPSGYRIT